MAAMSSSMIFYVRMEKVRGRGGTVQFCIVSSMYLYVDFGVPKTRTEQELLTSASEKGNHRRSFLLVVSLFLVLLI